MTDNQTPWVKSAAVGERSQTANKTRPRGQGGFTLIEMMVIIGILAILASVVIIAVSTALGNSRESACQLEQRTLRGAMGTAQASGDTNDTFEDYLADGEVPKYFTNSGTAAAPVWGPSGIHPGGKCTTTI
ncbi:MAG: type II secretion system protein [Microthrixaceae bacterium]|nr:type II secretion system protein [Microthrixaceae bacterium]